MATTSIENLSNEIFHEIFDYFDGYHLYKTFSNLNHRFQELLNSPTLLFKIHFHSQDNEIAMNEFKQFILLYKHKIISFGFYLPTKQHDFCSSFTIDASFNRLESLTLIQLEPTIHSPLLSNLTSLPRLFSLTINAWYSYENLNDVYRLVFALPKLKYIKCSTENDGVNSSLPIAMDKQFSSTENLVIDHPCTFSDLFSILSYTPQLSYLKFKHTTENDSTIHTLSTITLSNLTYISMDTHYVTFDQFERLISKLDCQLKVLRVITISPDPDYFNAGRWERLISDYLPQLEKLYFEYTKQLDPENNTPLHSEDPNQFISSFWIERGWLLEVKTDSFEVVYSIHPYKKRWYDAICSNELSKSTQLIISYVLPREDLIYFTMSIHDMLTMAHIYHLEISSEKTDFSALINVIHDLPKLDTLEIHSLSLFNSIDLFNEEKKFRLIPKKNIITKVCLEKMIEMEEVLFLMELCSQMNYLQVNCINDIDVELFIRDILSKINKDCNQYLRLLHIYVPTADDKKIRDLERMINTEKLIVDYTIKRVVDTIYLEWK